jgi:hypothetical protein
MEQLFALKRKLVLALSITIAVGFFIALLVSYSVAKISIHNTILNQQLPLTSNSVYSDLKNEDLGIFISPRPTHLFNSTIIDYMDYGLNLDKVNTLINLYKKEFNHNVYLANLNGDIIISTRNDDFKMHDQYQQY